MKILGSPLSVRRTSFDDVPINVDSYYSIMKTEFIVPNDGFYIFMADATRMGPVGGLMFSYLERKENGVRKYYLYDSKTDNRGKGRHMLAI